MTGQTLQLHQPRSLWREHGFALGVTLALHVGLGLLLFSLSSGAPLPPAVAAVIKTQLVSLPAPVVAPAPPPVAIPDSTPPAPVPEPTVAPKVEQAQLALKRVEQQRKEQAQRVERERQQHVREEARRREQLAKDEQQRQERLQQERVAQEQRAASERQTAARAEAEAQAAASRQYLPIAKEAPDYPARALDRRIEGECTVGYTVNAQGRVENPQVVGQCHPLFVSPSLAAAKTFRYQPRLVNGQAVAVANVKNTFTYRIQ